MKTLEKNITKTKTFFSSDLEMFEELDRTEQRYKNWEIKTMSFEKFFEKSQKKLKTLSLNNL